MEEQRKRIHKDVREGDLIAMAITTHQADLGSEDTRWIYEQFGDDVTTVEYLLRGAAGG